MSGEVASLDDLDGKIVQRSDFAGRSLWVNFRATWCPSCPQEISDLRDAYNAYVASGLILLAIDVQEPRYDVADYAQTYKLTYRVGVDVTGAIMRAYRIFGLPTHYFVGTDGIIRNRYYDPLSRAQIEANLAEII